jgi:hypothetical protein
MQMLLTAAHPVLLRLYQMAAVNHCCGLYSSSAQAVGLTENMIPQNFMVDYPFPHNFTCNKYAYI